MKAKDIFINDYYTINVYNARVLSEFIKNKYIIKYGISDFSVFYNTKNREEFDKISAYINPVTILCDNVNDILESNDILLLDGFLRLLMDDIPDVDIIVKSYDYNTSDVNIFTLLFHLNHWKFFHKHEIGYCNGMPDNRGFVDVFFDRGVTQLLKLRFDIDISSKEKLEFLRYYITRQDKNQLADIQQLLTDDNVLDRFNIIIFCSNLWDKKISNVFITYFFYNYKKRKDIKIDHIISFFKDKNVDRLLSHNRADVISREINVVIDDFNKHVDFDLYNKVVLTPKEQKDLLKKTRLKIKSKYRSVGSLHDIDINDKEQKYYIFKEIPDGYNIIELNFSRVRERRTRYDGIAYYFIDKDNKEYLFYHTMTYKMSENIFTLKPKK
jgi:hypothetical protein